MVSYCQNEGVNSFFVVEVDMTKVNSYEIDMLYNNFVEGIIQPEFRSIDGEMLLYNKINGMKSLKDFMLGNKLSARQAFAVIESVCDVISEAEDYMLNPGSLMIKPEYVFCSMGEDEYRFIYTPGVNMDVKNQIRHFVEEILRNIDHGDSRLVDFMYGIYEMVVVDNFDIELLKKAVQERKKENDLSYANKLNPERIDNHIRNSDHKSESGFDENVDKDGAAVLDAGKYCGKKMESDKKNGETGINRYERKNRGDGMEKSRWYVMLIAITIVVGSALAVFQISKYGAIVDARMFMVVIAAVAMEIFLYLEFQRRNDKMSAQPAGGPMVVEPSAGVQSTSDPLDIIDGTSAVKEETLSAVISSDAGIRKETRLGGTQVLMENYGDTTLLMETDGCGRNMPHIVLGLVDKEKGESIVINVSEEELVLGRDSTVDVVLNDKNISRRHISVCEKGGRVYVKDLGSTNGTFVNEIRLCRDKYWPFAGGDTLRLGSREYNVQISLI